MTTEHLTASTEKGSSLEDLQGRIMFLGAHGLLTFELPEPHTDEQVELAHRIGLLDKRAYRELGFGSPQWEAVIQLLVNAIALGVIGGRVDYGKDLLQEAEKTLHYYRTLTTRNRVTYLAGALLSSVAVGALCWGLSTALEPELPARKFVLACVFASLGSLASILSRLAEIPALAEEHPRIDILISGASRPVVAAIFAVVVTVILSLHIIVVHVGEQASAEEHLYLLTSFLCGFSERFAQEILGRFAPEAGEKAEKD